MAESWNNLCTHEYYSECLERDDFLLAETHPVHARLPPQVSGVSGSASQPVSGEHCALSPGAWPRFVARGRPSFASLVTIEIYVA